MSITKWTREATLQAGTVAVNLTNVGGTAITLGQKTMAASVPVVIASDQATFPVTATISGTPAINISQYGGVATTLGSKVSASSIPVVVASDQGDIGINIDKFGGVATTLGSKVSASSIPVVVASDQGDIGINIDKFGGTATTLGQKLKATSIPVVVASDQPLGSAGQGPMASSVPVVIAVDQSPVAASVARADSMKFHVPAAATQATITFPATASKRWVLNSLVATLRQSGATGQVAHVRVWDGATGTTQIGDFLLNIGTTANTVDRVVVDDAAYVTTAGNAMTIDFDAAGPAGTFEQLSASAYQI